MGRRRRKQQQQQQQQDHTTIDVSNCRIAIVGAGLCGLAVAVALERVLMDTTDTRTSGTTTTATTITIYERDESMEKRREGYGLTLSYRLDGTLDKLGILNELADLDCPSRSHYILRGDGRLIGYFGNAITSSQELGGGRGQRGNLRVPRQRVRHVLHNKLQRTSICWNHKLIGMEQVEIDDEDSSTDGGVNNKRKYATTTTTTTTTTAIKLSFQGGSSVIADFVIAADGIRSDVVRLQWPDLPPRRSLQVRLILGLTTRGQLGHGMPPTSPLLQEQGFYTLEPGCRLFVMPFMGSALGHSYDSNEPVRYMWQLSFREDGDDDDCSCYSFAPTDLLRQAKERTAGWHDPVSWLLDHTDEQDIWGTMLHDRDPTAFHNPNQQSTMTTTTTTNTHVIVAGDALHAMSPFKGQGANQSLQDALVIAKWIGGAGAGAGQQQRQRGKPKPKSRSAIVTCCQRELVQRTAPIVQASREAAQYWHSNAAVIAPHSWAGVTNAAPLVAALEANDIRVTAAANTTLDIDQAVRNLVNVMKDQLDITPAKQRPPPRLQEAHAAAKAGCLPTLRRLSWENQDSVRLSECLKIAAQEGHLRVVHWLINECGCPVDFATDHLSSQVRLLMERLQ